MRTQPLMNPAAPRRYRWALIVLVCSLCISALLLGMVSFARRRVESSVRAETQLAASLLAQHLDRALQQRRATLTLLRDTLETRPDITVEQMGAIASSAVVNTQQLSGIGIIRPGVAPTWWRAPKQHTGKSLARLDRVLQGFARAPRAWTLAMVHTVAVIDGRPLLIFMEPLRKPAHIPRALIGVFELTPLLQDFFALHVNQRYRLRLLRGHDLLYQMRADYPVWLSAAPVAQAVFPASLKWTLWTWPANSRIVQTLGLLNMALMVLSCVVGGALLGLLALIATTAWRLQHAVNERTNALRQALIQVNRLASVDELTGVYNRRYFLDWLKREHARAKRYNRPLSCLMIDVNGFKQINDTLGHPTGDVVLKRVAQEIRQRLRETDLLARLGGDEFVVALPETDLAHAKTVAEKLGQVRIQPAQAPAHLAQVSLSIGASALDRHRTPDEVLAEADQALYQVKRLRVPSAAEGRRSSGGAMWRNA